MTRLDRRRGRGTLPINSETNKTFGAALQQTYLCSLNLISLLSAYSVRKVISWFRAFLQTPSYSSCDSRGPFLNRGGIRLMSKKIKASSKYSKPILGLQKSSRILRLN